MGEQVELTVQDWNGVTSFGCDNADRQTSVRYPTDQAIRRMKDEGGRMKRAGCVVVDFLGAD